MRKFKYKVKKVFFVIKKTNIAEKIFESELNFKTECNHSHLCGKFGHGNLSLFLLKRQTSAGRQNRYFQAAVQCTSYYLLKHPVLVLSSDSAAA